MPQVVTATSQQLRLLIEDKYGGDASELYVVPVRHIAGSLVWEGEVHVFHLTSRPGAREAYAWNCPFDGETHTALKTNLIIGPVEAVRATLQERGWLGRQSAKGG